ncbi:MAG: hypothetical protein WBF67_05040, partial [Olleya sp.]
MLSKNIYHIVSLIFLTVASFQQTRDTTSNLQTFARAYGYIKYFHPSYEASKIDWNAFATYGAEEIIKCETKTEVIKTLN